MDEGDREDRATRDDEPAFLRLVDSGGTVLVEVDQDGYAVREVILASDGRPRRAAAGPEVTDYVYDYAIPTLRPGSRRFDEHFGGRWERTTAEEFEAAYHQAELHPLRFRQLPRKDQRAEAGTCLLITVVGLVAFFVVAFAIAIVMQLLALAAKTFLGLPLY